MTLTLHLPAADAALIRQYATEKGLSVSELIRRCVLERIEDEFDLETYRKKSGSLQSPAQHLHAGRSRI